MKYQSTLVWAAGLLVLGMGCRKGEEAPKTYLETEIANVRHAFAPDKRVAIFQVEAAPNGKDYVLRGESNLPEAMDSLRRTLKAEKIAFVDSVRMLPDASLGNQVYGLVNLSVANLRSGPAHSAELATQALMGTPLNIYKKEGNWWYVQTPDQYLGWVDGGGLVTKGGQELAAWRTSDKIIFTSLWGHALGAAREDALPVSDLVAGNILQKIGERDTFFEVRFPDGRTGFVAQKDAQDYGDWVAALDPTPENLVATAEQFMGIPYLWGGTSTKGVDCSGFTKTVYFLNGIILPRDASQQVHAGQPIDSVRNFDALEAGDLMFFGSKATDSTAERVTHVGMWIGGHRFIHSSGRVHINSMDTRDSLFDPSLLERYLRSQRMLEQKDDALIELRQSTVFMD